MKVKAYFTEFYIYKKNKLKVELCKKFFKQILYLVCDKSEDSDIISDNIIHSLMVDVLWNSITKQITLYLKTCS